MPVYTYQGSVKASKAFLNDVVCDRITIDSNVNKELPWPGETAPHEMCAPFHVFSSTHVANLNVDAVDNVHSNGMVLCDPVTRDVTSSVRDLNLRGNLCVQTVRTGTSENTTFKYKPDRSGFHREACSIPYMGCGKGSKANMGVPGAPWNNVYTKTVIADEVMKMATPSKDDVVCDTAESYKYIEDLARYEGKSSQRLCLDAKQVVRHNPCSVMFDQGTVDGVLDPQAGYVDMNQVVMHLIGALQHTMKRVNALV